MHPSWETAQRWALIGGAIGGVLFVVALINGKPLSDSVNGILFCAAMGGAFGLYRGGHPYVRNSGQQMTTPQQEVADLRDQLGTALYLAASDESRGNFHSAAQHRARAAVLESRLRAMGA